MSLGGLKPQKYETIQHYYIRNFIGDDVIENSKTSAILCVSISEDERTFLLMFLKFFDGLSSITAGLKRFSPQTFAASHFFCKIFNCSGLLSN